jgi:HEAT repeat protein
MAAAIYLSVEDVLGEIKVDFGDEKIKLRTRNSTRDEIFQRIAAERKLTLRFYCFDPVSTTEKLSANRQFPSINALLEWIVNQALEIDLADPTGAATKAIADASTIDARPRDCDPEGGPVRTYRDWHSVPGLRGAGADADLAVLSEILAKEGPDARMRVAHLLKAADQKEALALAARALHDPNAEVVVSAARALAVLGAKFDRGFAAGAVHEALTETSYIELIMPLAQLAGTRSWAVIEPLLESDDASARALGVNALALTRDTRGVARLIDFTRSEDVPLAAQSTMVLGLIGGIEAADRLVALLREDDATLRAPAVRAITLLSGPPAATGRQAIFDAVLREPVGGDIVLALISATYLEPLERMMTDATVSTEARIAVLRTLATVADSGTVRVSAMALQDIDPEVRRDAVMALSSVGNEPAMRHLVRAAGDAEAVVRAAAVEGRRARAGARRSGREGARGGDQYARQARRADREARVDH